jgi:hypothetical protein
MIFEIEEIRQEILIVRPPRTNLFTMSKSMAKSLQGFSIVTVKNRQYRVATASLDAKSTTRTSAPRQGMPQPFERIAVLIVLL